MSEKCVIFAGAEINDISGLEIDSDTFVISADAGYRNALKFGIKPHLAMGDFDTLDSRQVTECEKIVFPPEKDDTDTMIAVKTALERGYKDITIIGALGGRFDHTMANVQTLIYIAEHGGKGKIIGDNDVVSILKNSSATYSKKEDVTFSVFSLTERSEGVTARGFKYNLEDAVLTYDYPIGVSNEMTEDECFLEVKRGVLLIIFSKESHQI